MKINLFDLLLLFYWLTDWLTYLSYLSIHLLCILFNQKSPIWNCEKSLKLKVAFCVLGMLLRLKLILKSTLGEKQVNVHVSTATN